jgi:hypothetical protein
VKGRRCFRGHLVMEERGVLASRLSLSCQASVKVEVVELGIGTYMAITEPGINAGLGDPGLSEKGENVDIRALADGGLRGDRTAIIMATYATEWRWE